MENEKVMLVRCVGCQSLTRVDSLLEKDGICENCTADNTEIAKRVFLRLGLLMIIIGTEKHPEMFTKGDFVNLAYNLQRGIFSAISTGATGTIEDAVQLFRESELIVTEEDEDLIQNW